MTLFSKAEECQMEAQRIANLTLALADAMDASCSSGAEYAGAMFIVCRLMHQHAEALEALMASAHEVEYGA